MGKIIFSIRVSAFFCFPGRSRRGGTLRRDVPNLGVVRCRQHGGHGQGTAAPAFLPARHGSVFQQDFKCPISFINTFGAMFFQTGL